MMQKKLKKGGMEYFVSKVLCLKDAIKAVDIGADAIMISNHGGRQLDGSRSPLISL